MGFILLYLVDYGADRYSDRQQTMRNINLCWDTLLPTTRISWSQWFPLFVSRVTSYHMCYITISYRNLIWFAQDTKNFCLSYLIICPLLFIDSAFLSFSITTLSFNWTQLATGQLPSSHLFAETEVQKKDRWCINDNLCFYNSSFWF